MLESFKNKIFSYEKLTEEDQQRRGILGRLVGIIADSKQPTRNGRLYSKDLWEKVFADPIMQEKITNRCCFGELGHPTDREEVDPEKIAICLAETPKFGDDGKLYGVFDIISTPCGKILKTLCDYGCTIGVSSRGSGDIMANDEVDPETYFCECWDAVIIPAVKEARVKLVTESLNNKNKNMKTALVEEYNKANEEDKKIMKEALDNLEFDLDFPEPCKDCDNQVKEAAEYTVADIDWDNLPEASDESDEVLMEDEKLVIDVQPVENIPETDVPEEIPEETDEVIEDEFKEEEIPAEMPVEEVVDKIEEVAEEIKEVVEADEDQAEAIDEVVEEKKEELLPEEDSKEEADEANSEDIKDEQPEEEIPEDEDKEENSEDENDEEVEEDSEEADDDGMEEALNNLKEMIRQKGLLENEVKSLKNEKTVSDAEVARLKEELNKYKTGFARVSELASKSTQFEKEVQSLTEQLALKDKELTDLKTRSTTNTALTESVNAHKTQVKSLTETLDAMQKDLTATETKLNEQKVQYKNKLTEAVAVAKDYKAKYDSVISKYIESRASMLGVKPATIINQLNESYSIEDVDNVCDKLLEADYGFNSFTFGFGNNPRVKVSESKKVQEDDDLSDLYELAGLK